MPKVTVLLPVFNAMPYLPRAMESLLEQSFQDFEILALDDASTDASLEYLRSVKDARCKVIPRPKTGLSGNLNHGLSLSEAPYIARMDADDVSMPERLRKQVDFLDRHPDYVACGTYLQFIDPEGRPAGRSNLYPDDARILWNLLFNSALAHPSVCMRRKSLLQAGLYRGELEPAEDYALWWELSRRGRLANIPEPLLQYRLHPGSVSSRRAEIQQRKVREISVQYLLDAQYALHRGEAESFQSVLRAEGNYTADVIRDFLQVAWRFLTAHRTTGRFRTRDAAFIRWRIRRTLLGLARRTRGRVRWRFLKHAMFG